MKGGRDMPDREKVIKELDDAWHTLDEWDNGNEEFICVQLVKDQIFDALALLKREAESATKYCPIVDGPIKRCVDCNYCADGDGGITMPDREKVISTLEEIKTQTAEIGLDSAVIAHKFIDEIIALLKEHEAVVKQWTKEIADNQLAYAPDDRDSGNKYLYKKGIWDGLQIAWNIISEGR
jgi:hypothetical protein